MAKDVWHKIEGGSFNKKDKKYDYVIEQNKNQAIDKGGVRLRITKTVPKVKAIRTRYEPHVEVDGEDGAYVPSYFGYNPKRLLGWISPVLVLYGTVMIFFLFVLNIDITAWAVGLIPSVGVEVSEAVTQGLVWFLKIAFTFMMVFCLALPITWKTIQKFKLYFHLKKHGLDYNQLVGNEENNL